ncbi:tetratricopeptide repeat protein [Polaribacter sp. Hel1_85]|uniref:tetratricopeptide repeat protein n=1 Tax=Polaribacter sp. Hel1_85 TaxID=1250005 RepID=UPI00052C2529|nr:tetratricopeptide repeat protein [Polaribacter sp. Hel1_85]KGL62787.1 TPR repeat protein-containing protein [Polaribacter sp. Hel1_85]
MRFVFLRKRFFTYFIFLISFIGYSQQTIIDASILTKYNDATKLFNNKAYAAAQKIFIKIDETAITSSNLKSDAAYYDAICAVKLNQPEADKKVLAFIEENPNSNKKNKAFINVANYYFANKKAAYALKWYQKVNVDILSKEDRKELNFKMGYSYLVTKNLTLAKKQFLPLINDPKYGNDSRYYYGYIAYKLEDYGIAESTLKEIADNDTYRIEISYYLLDISFQAGKFERCVVVGEELIKTVKRKERSEISKIIGESYFNLKKYSEAIPYLKAYTGKKGKWNNTDYYQLGFAYYQQNDFENAISNFNKIIDQKNYVAQNAYYNLGECYLKLDKKSEALNAFKTASEMEFNKSIKQDAALNYAKLSYEAGNPFKSVAEVLQDYLKAYPKSKAYEEINDLVISSFLHQQDYTGALTFLTKKKSNKNSSLISEISLYRGIQLFNNDKLKEALPFFKISKKSENSEIQQKAQYWEAEAFYRLANYREALTKFMDLNKFLKSKNDEEYSLIDYNIGYSYFQLKEYEKATEYFVKFLKKDIIESQIKDDAFIRLGDSYFATRNYKKAINSYKQVLQNFGSDADYAQYQIGMSFGFTEDNKSKIEALTKVVNDYQISDLKDDALFQLANTYTLIKNNEKAHQAYNRLIKKHPNSIFLPKALVRQGLLYYNDNQNEKALEKFKKTTSQFPNSPDAFEAVANARNIYIDSGNLDDYISWIATLKFINVTNSDLDNTSFAVAEKKYFESKNGDDIIDTLLKYTQSFPNGIHKLKANYYLADILFKVKEFDRAITYYEVILEEEQNEYSEDSLAKLAQIFLEKDEFNNALPLLDRLEQESYATENILFAQSNLMKGYYETEAFDFALEYAKKILLRDKLENKLENDAKIIIARASLKNDDFYTAEEYYTEVERNASGELKAEALYYNAFFKNQQNEFTDSNKIIQNLIANYSSYKYWAVKSYVIMGKNYYGLKDAYQATFVLENIIKNFKQFKDIVEEAEKELKTIKENEAKTNNSVTPLNEEDTDEKDSKKNKN